MSNGFDPSSLTQTEQRVLEACAKGIAIEFPAPTKDQLPQATVRGIFLRAALLGLAQGTGSPLAAPVGIRIRNARIEGVLDLTDVGEQGGNRIPAIALEHCYFTDPIIFDHARLARLSLLGSRVNLVQGVGCVIDGSLNISELRSSHPNEEAAECRIALPFAKVNADIYCVNSTFFSGAIAVPALLLNEIEIKGSLHLEGTTSRGAMTLPGVRIVGSLHANGLTVLNRTSDGGATAIVADNSRVGGSVHFHGLNAEGVVRFVGAKVDGDFSCVAARILNLTESCSGIALVLDKSEIAGALLLREKFQAEGIVHLMNLKVAGNVDFHGATLSNRSTSGAGVALTLANAIVGGALRLHGGFGCKGKIDLSSAKIAGSIFASDAQIDNQTSDRSGTAIAAGGVEIGGVLALGPKLSATGAVSFFRARVGAGVEATSSTFTNYLPDNGNGIALEFSEGQIEGSIQFGQGSSVQGLIRMIDCSVSGSADFSGTRINNLPTEGAAFAVVLNGTKIGKSIGAPLGGLQINGRLSLDRMRIGGSVQLAGAELKNPHASGTTAALSIANSQVEGSIDLSGGFKAQGKIDLSAVTVLGDLDCCGALIENRTPNGSGVAIAAYGARISGSVKLCHKFKAEGLVLLPNSIVGGSLNCHAGEFRNQTPDAKGVAINASGAKVLGTIYLSHGFKAEGAVLLQSVEVGGYVDARRGTIVNLSAEGSGSSLDLDFAAIASAALLRDEFRSEGELSFYGARIQGDVDLSHGVFLNLTNAKFGRAIRGTNAEIGGSLLFSKQLQADGEILFDGARVAKTLWVAVDRTSRVKWVLINSNVGELHDGDGSGWGNAQTPVVIDGLKYQHLHVSTFSYHSNPLMAFIQSIGRGLTPIFVMLWRNPLSRLARAVGLLPPEAVAFRPGIEAPWESRLRWLRAHLEKDGEYKPGPYIELAKAFRQLGYDEDSRRILRHKRWRMWRFAEPWVTRIPSFFFGSLFAFGYSPTRAIVTLFAFLAAGWWATNWANQHGMMALDTMTVASVVSQKQPAMQRLPPELVTTTLQCGTAIHPALYAIDVFVPLIDLRQESKCEPAFVGPETPPQLLGLPTDDADFWRWAKAAYALVGWIVTSLAILTFSGVMQRRGEEG